MKDLDKPKEQLAAELEKLRRRVNDLEKSENKYRKAEEELKESEEKYRTLVNDASDAIILADVNGRILDVNRRMEMLLGYAKGELLNKNIVHIHPEEELTRTVIAFKDIISKGSVSLNNGYILTKNGRSVPVDITGSLVRYSGQSLVQGIFRDITGRKESEDALKESEEQFRSLFQNSIVGIVLAVYDGRIIAANPAALKMFGYSEDEMRSVGRNGLVDTMDPRLPSLLVDMARTGKFKGELRLVRKDGNKFPAVVSCSAYHTKEGLERTVIIINDLTDIKKTQERLYASEVRYRRLIDTLQEGVWVVDEKALTVFVNPRMADMLGYSVPEMEGKALFSFMAQEDIAKCEEKLKKRRNGIKERFDFRLIKKDGSIIHVNVEAAPIFDEHGVYQGSIAGVTDITERKRIEKELKESEEKFRDIFEKSPMGIFQSTFEGRFIDVNPALSRMMGYDSPQEVIGSIDNIADQIYVNPEQRDEVVKIIKKTPEAVRFESMFYKKDGKKWAGKLTMRLIHDENSRPHHMDGFIEDITQQKIVEERLHRAMEQLGMLSRRLLEVQEAERRHIARELHDEIGQVLTAVKINLQAIERSSDGKLPDMMPLKESVRIIDRLLRQVRSLSIELHPSILDDLGLIAALRWYIDWIFQQTGLSGQFVTEFARERLAPAIELACFRIVQESLTNAVRHANAKNVIVELGKYDKELYLKIRDDGSGFDVKKARERALKGKSLGLLGMEERVFLLGGRIEVKSERGKGTAINVFLPLDYTMFKKRKNRVG